MLSQHKINIGSCVYRERFQKVNWNSNANWSPSGSRPMLVQNMKLIYQCQGGLHNHALYIFLLYCSQVDVLVNVVSVSHCFT